jgi:DNA repair protein RadC
VNEIQGVFRSSGARSPFTDNDLISDLLGLPAGKVAETLRPYSLRDLGQMTEVELKQAGLTPNRAKRLRSAFELARRYSTAGKALVGKVFGSPKDIFEAFHLRDEKKEHFFVVTLDARHRVLGEHLVSVGSLSSSIVHPREVFRPAIREAAGAVVLVHNHPSGDPRPSEEDVAVTRRLVSASEMIGIRVLDHVVIGDGRYSSFREEGLV